jgi:hypothetical protein
MQFDQQPKNRSRFLLSFLQKKPHFIEYLVQILWFEWNRCQNA